MLSSSALHPWPTSCRSLLRGLCLPSDWLQRRFGGEAQRAACAARRRRHPAQCCARPASGGMAGRESWSACSASLLACAPCCRSLASQLLLSPPVHARSLTPNLQTPAARRQSAGARQLALQPTITAVVTDRRSRTPKYLYAAIIGLPVVKPAWVLACAAAKKQLPMRSQHLWLPPAAPGGGPAAAAAAANVFAGLRVHLHGAKQFTEPFGQLLQHAGAGPGWEGLQQPWLATGCSLLLQTAGRLPPPSVNNQLHTAGYSSNSPPNCRPTAHPALLYFLQAPPWRAAWRHLRQGEAAS